MARAQHAGPVVLAVGQLTASLGFAVYSWLIGNWVFVATNVMLLATALLGQWIFRRNRRQAGDGRGSAVVGG